MCVISSPSDDEAAEDIPILDRKLVISGKREGGAGGGGLHCVVISVMQDGAQVLNEGGVFLIIKPNTEREETMTANRVSYCEASFPRCTVFDIIDVYFFYPHFPSLNCISQQLATPFSSHIFRRSCLWVAFAGIFLTGGVCQEATPIRHREAPTDRDALLRPFLHDRPSVPIIS